MLSRTGSGSQGSSLLAHASDINDLLEGLDGVLENGLDGLHDTESSLHIVDLGLHALDGLHLSGDLNEGLTVIESLEVCRLMRVSLKWCRPSSPCR